MSDHILDAYASSAEHRSIRTRKLVLLEKVCIYLYSLFILMNIFSLRRFLEDSDLEYLWLYLIYIIGIIITLVSLFWWRRVSISYDKKEIPTLYVPPLLRVFRAGLFSWVLFSFWQDSQTLLAIDALIEMKLCYGALLVLKL